MFCGFFNWATARKGTEHQEHKNVQRWKSYKWKRAKEHMSVVMVSHGFDFQQW